MNCVPTPERLAHIIMQMQRCFILNLSKELAPGNVSFPQYFLLDLSRPQGSADHVGHRARNETHHRRCQWTCRAA